MARQFDGSSRLPAFCFFDGGLQFLGLGANFVHGLREFTRKHLQVVALLDQDSDVALKSLARLSHAATSIRLSKEGEKRSIFPRPFHGSRRESPQVFGVRAPFFENLVDHTMRLWSQFGPRRGERSSSIECLRMEVIGRWCRPVRLQEVNPGARGPPFPSIGRRTGGLLKVSPRTVMRPAPWRDSRTRRLMPDGASGITFCFAA
jgi:hypothetical protein